MERAASYGKTPEQYVDKSRDRGLCLDGWTTLRFTGAEVYASAYSCACSVHKVMCKRLEDWPHRKVA